MKGLLSIGELSKLQNISRQTLIFYDKINLFNPVYIDPNNGYRYYSVKQMDYLDTILIMKKIGFSLEEIKEFMKSYSIEQSIDIFKKQIPILSKQIEELEMIKTRVEHRVEELEKSLTISNIAQEVMFEEIPKQNIFIQKVRKPYTLEEVSFATKKCFVKAFKRNVPVFFQSGAIISLDNLRNGKYTLADYAFLTCEDNCEMEGVVELAKGKGVSIYHIGDYLSIGNTYDKILNYCDEHNIKLISNSYEFAINDYLSTSDENEYITKIVFYIEIDK